MSDLTAAVEAATPAVLTEMDWPDDREFSAHVEPDGYQLTPPGAYWDAASDVALAAITAAAPIIEAAARADERTKTAEDIARALLDVDPIEWALAGQSAGVEAAAIARQHANGMPNHPSHASNPHVARKQLGNHPESHHDATTDPAAYERTPKPAQGN